MAAIMFLLTPGPLRNREAITLTSSPRGPVNAVSLSSFWSNFLLDRVKSGADFGGAPDVVPSDAGIGDEVIDPFFVERVIAHVAAGRAVGVVDPFLVVGAVAGSRVAGVADLRLGEKAIAADVIEGGIFFAPARPLGR